MPPKAGKGTIAKAPAKKAPASKAPAKKAAKRAAKAASPRKVNLAAAFAKIKEPWSPHVAGDINDCQVKLARMEGSFVWHHHDHEDECFLVVRGRMRMRFRTGDVTLEAGELIVVPRGVEHCPEALTDSTDVLLLEQNTTLNTGSAADKLGATSHERSRSGQALTKTKLARV